MYDFGFALGTTFRQRFTGQRFGALNITQRRQHLANGYAAARYEFFRTQLAIKIDALLHRTKRCNLLFLGILRPPAASRRKGSSNRSSVSRHSSKPSSA